MEGREAKVLQSSELFPKSFSYHRLWTLWKDQRGSSPLIPSSAHHPELGRTPCLDSLEESSLASRLAAGFPSHTRTRREGQTFCADRKGSAKGDDIFPRSLGKSEAMSGLDSMSSDSSLGSFLCPGIRSTARARRGSRNP